MKNRIEVEKNSSGRVESGIVTSRGKKLKFSNEWDDDGFLRARTFEGITAVLPSAVDMIRGIDQEFIERIRQIDVIDEIVNIQKIDEVHVANATVQNIVLGYDYTERWNRGYFDRTKYFGRTEPFYLSEAEEPPPYAVPTMVKGINTVQPFPMNNAIWMRNSKDGIIQDEIYFGIPLAFNKAVLRFDARLPTVAEIGAADDFIAIGFECCSQGGTTAAWLSGAGGNYRLEVIYMTPTGAQSNSVVVVPTHTNQWSQYWLQVNWPMIRLLEYSGAWLLLGEVVALEPNVGSFYFCPFFCNESATNIVTNFYIGNISVWKLEGKPLPGTETSAANTALSTIIQTMDAKSIALRMGVTAGTMIGNTNIYVSSDGTTYDLVDTYANGAVAFWYKAYDDAHLSTTKPTNPTNWPFIKVIVDAQGAGKFGTVHYALK